MRCTIVTEGFGDMVFELYPKLAPITVKNFVDTARSGFYDGLAWCRIVKGYVIQGGTAGTQFFVVHQDAAKLDGRYAAFGQMVSGFEVLDAIADVPTFGPDTWNRPLTMPVIKEIRIEEE